MLRVVVPSQKVSLCFTCTSKFHFHGGHDRLSVPRIRWRAIVWCAVGVHRTPRLPPKDLILCCSGRSPLLLTEHGGREATRRGGHCANDDERTNKNTPLP